MIDIDRFPAKLNAAPNLPEPRGLPGVNAEPALLAASDEGQGMVAEIFVEAKVAIHWRPGGSRVDRRPDRLRRRHSFFAGPTQVGLIEILLAIGTTQHPAERRRQHLDLTVG